MKQAPSVISLVRNLCLMVGLLSLSIQGNEKLTSSTPAAKFLPSQIIDKELNIAMSDAIPDNPWSAAEMIATNFDNRNNNMDLAWIDFPAYVQEGFEKQFNLQLHIAYIFYIIGLIHIGAALIVGITAFKKGSRGFALPLLTVVCISFSDSTL
jgi:hypothetical protein